MGRRRRGSAASRRGKAPSWFDQWVPRAALLVAGTIVAFLALQRLLCVYVCTPGWLAIGVEQASLAAAWGGCVIGAIEGGVLSACSRADLRGERMPFSVLRHGLAFVALFAAFWLVVWFGYNCNVPPGACS